MKDVAVMGGFDDINSHHIRFLEEAAKLGPVTVLLFSDDALEVLTGKSPRFPLNERMYFLNAVRFVSRVLPVGPSLNLDVLPSIDGFEPKLWADETSASNDSRRTFCRELQLEYCVFSSDQLKGFPQIP